MKAKKYEGLASKNFLESGVTLKDMEEALLKDMENINKLLNEIKIRPTHRFVNPCAVEKRKER